jgi:hypothetical protein
VALSAFDDPAHPPTEVDLAAILGPASPLWTNLVADVARRASDTVEAWRYGGPTFGWSMRLVRKDRNLLYLTPQAGTFIVGVALGEKAIAAAEASGIASTRTLEIVAAAPKYAEGRGVRYPVALDDDLAVARELARIKLAR